MTLTNTFAGRVDITPDRPLPLFGRLGQTANFASVTSRLEANALVLAQGAVRVALVALDTLYPSQALLDAVLAKLAANGHPLGADQLLLVASHTHNAPALDATKPLLGRMDAGYLAEVADKIAVLLSDLLAQAANGPHPAQMRVGVAECRSSVFRRRQVWGLTLPRMALQRRAVMVPNPSVKIDQRLHLVVWENAGGLPLAALWHWPCHAVSEADKNTISADFPGLVRQRLRAKLGQPDLPVLFLPGFSGDIRPMSRAFLPLIRQGRWFGLARRFQRNAPARQAKLTANIWAAMDQAYAGLTPVADVPLTTSHHALPLSDLRQDMPADTAPMTVQDWQVSGLRLTAVSAEVSHAYAPETQSLHLFTGCAQQVFGYLPTDTQIIEGGYEAGEFAPAFSLPGEFHARIEHHLRRVLSAKGPRA